METETETEIDTQTDRYRQTDPDRKVQTDKQTNRRTGRQTDRRTDGRTDGRTDRQTDRHLLGGVPAYVHRHSQGDLGGLVREAGDEAVLLHMISAIEEPYACAKGRRRGRLVIFLMCSIDFTRCVTLRTK